MKNWSEFDVFEDVICKYMPARGEGDTMASQIVTAVNKLVYKWYNDGDVYDNTYYMEGWCNDLSSYANWLYEHVEDVRNVLGMIDTVTSDGEYEDLLYELAKRTLDAEILSKYECEKVGTIYDCEGVFRFEENMDDDDDDWY